MKGSLMWAGSGVLPQAACFSSLMQQSVPALIIESLLEANWDLKKFRDLDASTQFCVLQPELIPIFTHFWMQPSDMLKYIAVTELLVNRCDKRHQI